MRRRVYLHGSLKAIHPHPIEIEASTIAEAIRHVTLLLPGFRPNAKTGRRQIQAVGCKTVEDYFSVGDEEVHLLPAFHGGKNGGFLQIVIGAVLIAASFIPGIGQVLAPVLLKVGITMLLGGVLQLLTAPDRDRGGKQKKSQYLGSPRNTVDIGTRIPILYGRRKVGGHYLSFNISAVHAGV